MSVVVSNDFLEKEFKFNNRKCNLETQMNAEMTNYFRNSRLENLNRADSSN